MAEKPLGNLFVRVGADVKNFVTGMNRVDQRAKKTGGALGKLTKVLGPLGLAMGAVQLASFAKETLAMGVAAEETGSKFKTVFGDAADSTQEFIDSFANAAGLTNVAAQDIVATTGQIAQGMGFAEEASAKFAQQATILAADLASFNDVPIEQTSRAIQAALTGERESLKTLGIVIKEVDVQQRAMADTGKENAAQLTQQEKAAATFALIAERAGVAVGDLARTQDSAANASRRLKAQFGDIRVEVGKGLVPIFSKFLEFIQAAFDALQLGAVAAVGALAKLKLWWAKVFFGDVEKAEANLRFATIAMEEMREELADRVIPSLNLADAGFQAVTTSVQALVLPVVEFRRKMVMATVAVQNALIPLGELDVSWVRVQAAANMAAFSMDVASKSTDKAIQIIQQATAASASLFAVWQSNQGFFKKLGATLGLVGALITPFNPLLGAIVGGAGIVAGQFQHGGNIPGGQVGIVGEAGPELVSGPATITPMGGGDIVINIVTESGRQLVDSIRIKDKRDVDMRRVIRVPIAAIATG